MKDFRPLCKQSLLENKSPVLEREKSNIYIGILTKLLT